MLHASLVRVVERLPDALILEMVCSPIRCGGDDRLALRTGDDLCAEVIDRQEIPLHSSPDLTGENEGSHSNTATRPIERSALEVAQRRISAPYRSFGALGGPTLLSMLVPC